MRTGNLLTFLDGLEIGVAPGRKAERHVRHLAPLVFVSPRVITAKDSANRPIEIASLMPIKKSKLYSSLWSSCDELRGGMDASQYKDYVLVLLFIKYVSDKYAGVPYAPITIPAGASFKDMVALKGKSDIGDQVNNKIIGPLANANKLSDMPDFNDATKLASVGGTTGRPSPRWHPVARSGRF
jgi:hypothetical protein